MEKTNMVDKKTSSMSKEHIYAEWKKNIYKIWMLKGIFLQG